jgi:hypothetical protein
MALIPLSTAMELTRILVDVPISVVVPPIIPAKESGINILEGLTPTFDAIPIITGMKMATAAVLLMKAEMIQMKRRRTKNQYLKLSCIFSEKKSPAVFRIPVLLIPSLNTNIAATVTVAGLLNPERPSVGVRIPDPSRHAMIIIAVTSNVT